MPPMNLIIKRHALAFIWDKNIQSKIGRFRHSGGTHPKARTYLGKWNRVKWPTEDGEYGIRIRCWKPHILFAKLDPPREFTFTMKDGIMITDFKNSELPLKWLSNKTTITNRIRKCLLTHVQRSSKNGSQG